jgi:hypothetical protein
METSEPTPINQVDSQEVSPTQKENLESNGNRRTNSPASSRLPASVSLEHEETSTEERSNLNSDWAKPKSNPRGSKAIRPEPGKASKGYRKVKTRPGVIQVGERSFIARIELSPGPDGKRRRKKFTANFL